jgi:hypothetical protein
MPVEKKNNYMMVQTNHKTREEEKYLAIILIGQTNMNLLAQATWIGLFDGWVM